MIFKWLKNPGSILGKLFRVKRRKPGTKTGFALGVTGLGATENEK